jgi:chitin disaccharide deacetylase
MLIVNADDLGRSAQETDAALAGHALGRVTSASAMVFMADSERAAAAARQAKLPVGLHLNLSEAFSGTGVSQGLRSRHDRVRAFLARSRFALIFFNPLLAADFAAVVQAQHAEFIRLYGHAPRHVDGHQHMHLSTNVLLQRLLPAGARVRRSFSFLPHQKSPLNRGYRACVDRLLARRHPLTTHFFSLTQQLRGGGMARVASLAEKDVVELMVHPAWLHEWEYLTSTDFQRLVETTQ